MSKKTHLECACCGEYAGKWAQYWNQDTGYGMCSGCADWLIGRRMSREDFERTYGKEGVNWGREAAAVLKQDHMLRTTETILRSS